MNRPNIAILIIRLTFASLLLLLSACAPFLGGGTPTPAAAPVTLTIAPPISPTVPPSPTPPPTVISPTVPPPPIATTPAGQPPTLVVPPTGTPGIFVHGRVTAPDGSGLANIAICQSFASYPGTVVATTDTDGYYTAPFSFIPGDEMVTVWPSTSDYVFDPPDYYWRHYYGFEDRPLNFVGSPAVSTAVPPFPCQK